MKGHSRESQYFTTTDGVRIHYNTSENFSKTKELCLVFLHGMGGDLFAWDKTRDFFEDHGYRTLAVDLRGHGQSEDPTLPEAYDLDRLAEDIFEIIRKTKMGAYVLVGHCLGGMVSIVMGSKQDSKMTGLVLVDTTSKVSVLGFDTGTWPRFSKVLEKLAYLLPERKSQRHSSYEPFTDSSDFDLKRILTDVQATTLRSYLMSSSKIAKYDSDSLLSKITAPTLVICGENDKIFPKNVSKKIASRIKNSLYKEVKGTNHIIVFNKPQELSEEILGFVKKLK